MKPDAFRRASKGPDPLRLARLEQLPTDRLRRLVESGILGKLQPIAEAILAKRRGQ